MSEDKKSIIPSSKDNNPMSVCIYGVFSHGAIEGVYKESRGFTLQWECPKGFGEIRFSQTEDGIEIDSECMSDEFVVEALTAMVNPENRDTV